MAEKVQDLGEDKRSVIMEALSTLEKNAEDTRLEVNKRVDQLVETVNRHRWHFLDEIDKELAKAREPLKISENQVLAQLENAKKLLTDELEGNQKLIRTLSKGIDHEIETIKIELPTFKIQWKPSFTRLCDHIGEMAQLHIYKNSRFEKAPTPIWTSSLKCGKAENEVSEAKAFAIDPETSNIYVGDPVAPKILILNKRGEYLDTLKINKLPSIGRMAICQDSIFCKANSYAASTLYRLDKKTGKLVARFEGGNISAITAVSDQVLICDLDLKLNILTLTDLSIICDEVKLESPFLTKAWILPSIITAALTSSVVSDMECVKEELVTLVYNSKSCPIQVFSKSGILLRAIANEIPVSGFLLAYLCLDEHCNIILSFDTSKLVTIYNKKGKLIAVIGTDDDEISHPKCMALDQDGNLVMCNNRKRNILQAY